MAVLGADGVGGTAARARTVPGAASARSEVSFDEGWLLHRGDASGADAVLFDDGSWQPLDLPHDWSIEDLSYATSMDATATDYPARSGALASVRLGGGGYPWAARGVCFRS
jgi:hypothetical protein